VDFVPIRKKSAKEWEMVDVRRSEPLWCQTGVIFVIRQETFLFWGYMQRGVEIRHASERDNKWPKFKLDASSAARSHDFFDPFLTQIRRVALPSRYTAMACACGVLEWYSRSRSRSGENDYPSTGQMAHHTRSIDKSEINLSCWDNGLLFGHGS
jgi:hypothetical protein